MKTKQISVTMPETLLKASKQYSEEAGYLNIQELILDTLRIRVLADLIRCKKNRIRYEKG